MGLFAGWKASVLTFLRDLLPSNHTYLQEFQKTIDEKYPIYSNVYGGVNVLERLKDDILRGYLVGFKTLITAEYLRISLRCRISCTRRNFTYPPYL